MNFTKFSPKFSSVVTLASLRPISSRMRLVATILDGAMLDQCFDFQEGSPERRLVGGSPPPPHPKAPSCLVSPAEQNLH